MNPHDVRSHLWFFVGSNPLILTIYVPTSWDIQVVGSHFLSGFIHQQRCLLELSLRQLCFGLRNEQLRYDGAPRATKQPAEATRAESAHATLGQDLAFISQSRIPNPKSVGF